MAQKITRLNHNSSLKSIGVIGATVSMTNFILKKLMPIEAAFNTALIVGGVVVAGYQIYNKLSIDAALEELKRDLARDEKDLDEIGTLMKELEDPIERLNKFKLLLVKLFQVGADGLVNYLTSKFPTEKDVINEALEKIRQIFYDENLTSFMRNTNTTVNEIIPWGITSMNTIKMIRWMPAIIAKENSNNARIHKSIEKRYELGALNVIFTTSDVYQLIHFSLRDQKLEIIQALNDVAYKLQSQLVEIITKSPETNSLIDVTLD